MNVFLFALAWSVAGYGLSHIGRKYELTSCHQGLSRITDRGRSMVASQSCSAAKIEAYGAVIGGRHEKGLEALREFSATKTVVINRG
jgi:hypothetical protein